MQTFLLCEKHSEHGRQISCRSHKALRMPTSLFLLFTWKEIDFLIDLLKIIQINLFSAGFEKTLDLKLTLRCSFALSLLALWWYWLILSMFAHREPDIPAWAPLLYQLQLLDIREKPDPLTLPIADRIRIGNQKRERGNFHFQREEYCLAAKAYFMALEVLTTRSRGNPAPKPEFIHGKYFHTLT